MTTLISFLGKGSADKTTGYRSANYDFGNGTIRTVPYFGLALTAQLGPDRLVLVGTSGSMWDVFFEQQTELDEELIDAVSRQAVTDDLLARHSEKLAEKTGCPVDCLLIPYARDTAEQIEVLRALSRCVSENERVVLDVTHGFRHLPMLALVAARYLTHVTGVKIENIYYGALEMTRPDGMTPVLQLGGMLTLLDWVEALATYDKDGDYGVFASLLKQDGMPQAEQLAEAAFFERSSNPVKAREKLTSVTRSLANHAGPLSELFKSELQNRISWYRGNLRHEWELALANSYLERHDYVRAAIFLYEAFVSRACYEQRVDHNDYSQREAAWKKAKQNNQPARKLEYLRNALTHGIKPDDHEIAAMVTDEKRLAKKLQEFRRLLFT